MDLARGALAADQTLDHELALRSKDGMGIWFSPIKCVAETCPLGNR